MKADPKTTDFLLFVFFYFLTLLPCSRSKVPSTTGYPCEPAAYPCRTYAFYRATAPNFLNLGAVGDLFAVSRLMIAAPSNISSPSANLHPNQPLLVPLTCSCNAVSSNTTTAAAASGRRRLSYAPVNYTIKEGDTPYLLALYSFLNLTTFQSAFLVNPTLVPTTLSVGDTLVFPIFCKCPNRTQSTGKHADFLISYVYQPSDSLSSVASLFGADARSIIDLNGDQIVPFTTIFVPVNRLPRLPQTVFSSSSPPPPPPPAVVAAASAGTPERKGVTVGFGVGLGICGILLFLIVGLWAYREGSMRKWREMVREGEAARAILRGHSVSRGAKVGKEEEGMDDLGLNVTECLDKYTVYKIEDLRDATGGFDERCLIQGSVYKGSINGEAYAIKKMKWNAYEELKILQKVNHGNLVKLEGFCIDPEDANCYLVYEYMENGSLHSQLHGTQARKLSWKTRLRIAIDVANGLQYIHEHTRPRVVHKDIKSSNILLDSSMRAKIANFGLAKSGCNAITMHIVGTPGYIAPEYLADGVVSTKIDVFAFGVVLLELVSGREAVDEEGRVLWAGAAGVLEGDEEEEKVNQLRDWMDGDLIEELGSIGSVMDAMTVAVSCLHKDPFKRPSIVDIVYALCKKGDDASFEIPKDEFSATR